MEKVLNILTEYRSKGVRIGLDDKGINLSIKGNVAGLNDIDKQTLRDNKELLLDFLMNQRLTKIPSTPLNDGQKLPLSPNQKSIWLHARMEEDNTMYLIPFVHDLNIPSLDKEQLCLATEQLIQEHRILSFVFREEQGEIYQQTAEFNVSNHLFFENLSAFPLDRRKDVFVKAVQQSMQEGFNFMDQAPWSITVFDLGDDNYSFFLKIHHLIADGSTLSLLVENLVDAYKTQVSGNLYKNQGIQYHDYLNWISNKDHQKQSSEFWKKYLENRSDDFQFYLTEDIFEEAVSPLIDLKLSLSLKSDIDAFSKVNSVSVSHLFSFAFGFVLSKYGRTEDLILGTPVEGRSRPELTRVIGDLVNTLPLRLRLNYKQSIRENLNAFGKGFLSILEHQLYPLEYILDDINYERRQNEFPLFNTMVSFPNNQELGARNENEIQLGKEKALYDLTLSVLQLKNGIDLQLEFDSGKFSKTFVSNILDQTIIVLDQILKNPDGALTEVSLIRENEREEYLKAGLPHTEVKLKYNSALEAFEEKVNQTPQAIAILEGERSITYLELNQLSKSIAAKLQKEGIAKGDKIAIELPSGLNLIGSMLGIWAIGAVYVPLGTQLPQSRKEEIIQDCEAVCCIDNTFLSDLTTETPVEVINDSADVAYILYTSGSTGKPKGVVISHGALEAKMEEELELVKLDSIITLTLTSPSFDVSFLELLLPLVTGGRVVICEDKSNEEIYKLIIDHGVTILQGTPTYFSHFESEVVEDVSQLNSTLKLLCIGGESLNDVLVKRLKKKLPYVRINNHYGPTEITIDALVKQDVSEFKRNSLGKPFGNTGAIITDDYYNVLPEFVPGELLITGPSLAEGYWNLETETEQKFVKSSKLGTKTYRTGDLTICTPNGEVEFIGRKDKQVKYRGFRIELEEISARLRRIKGVKDAYTGILNNLLVSWVISENIKSDKFQSELKNSLPEYMIPAIFEEVACLPLNINGKVDKTQLPMPELLRAEYVAPRNEREQQLVELWKEVLKVEKIGIHDNFFALGGNSLSASKLINRYRALFNCEIGLKDIFILADLKAHVDLIKNASSGSLQPIKIAPRMAGYPLSIAQKRLWYASQHDEASIAYNMPFFTVISRALSEQLLEKSVYFLVMRHESLRTVFKEENNEIIQKIVATIEMSQVFSFIDLSLSENPEEESRKYVQNEIVQSFDLENGPLFKVAILKLNNESYVFFSNNHHIISDGWSTEILFTEFQEIYAAYEQKQLPELRELPIQYKDYCVWEKENIQNLNGAHEEFWLQKFKVPSEPLTLPSSQQRPLVRGYGGHAQEWAIGPKISNNLKELAIANNGSLYMILLASLKSLFYKYQYESERDFVIGMPTSGRNDSQLENQVGLYVNTLPIKTKISACDSFVELIQKVRHEVLSALEHQYFSLDLLIDKLPYSFDASRNPLYDFLVELQNYGSTTDGVEFDSETIKDKGSCFCKYDIEFTFKEIGQCIVLNVTYNSDIYDYESVNQLIQHYKHALTQLVEKPTSKLSQIEVITPFDKRVYELSNEQKSNSQDFKSLVEIFENSVRNTPNATAFITANETYTYAEVHERSIAFAKYLTATYNIQLEDPVAIQLPRGIDLIVALLGVLQSGGAFLPIAVNSPSDRTESILKESNCNIHITFGEWQEFKARMVDYSHVELRSFDDHPDRLVYILFTSGSSGRSKGVMIEQKGILNQALSKIDLHSLENQECLIHNSKFQFVGGTWQLWSPIYLGTQLYITDDSELYDLRKLLFITKNQGIKCLELIPSQLLDYLGSFSKYAEMEHLETLILTGESFGPELPRELHSLYPALSIYNGYGQTECSNDTMIYQCKKGDEKVLIGKAIRNVNNFILSSNQELLPVGCIGEICTSGPGVARGYINRPDLTEQKFIQIDALHKNRIYRTGDFGKLHANGNIECLGRIDGQIKIRGYRIEIGEIEEELLQFPGISSVKVLSVQGEKITSDSTLTAFYLGDKSVNTAEVKKELRKSLNYYMVPSVIIHLEEFPKLENEKVDSAKLRELSISASQSVAEIVSPRNDLEMQLSQIWSEILGIRPDEISVVSDFFEMGGHSLKAVRLSSRILKEFEVAFSIQSFFEGITIELMAETIENTNWIKTASELDEKEKHYEIRL